MMVGANVNFMDAELYYSQLDQIIARFNRLNTDIQMTHSTLSFFNELVEYHQQEMPVNYFDMMPIGDMHNNYFTGLFSSRENHKAYIRSAGQALSAINKLYSMELMRKDIKMDAVNMYLNASARLTRAVAEGQSIDSVTGVSRKVLADNIVRQISDAMYHSYNVTGQIITEAAKRLAGVELGKNAHWQWCVASLNSTKSLLDCPIANMTNSSNLNMVIAVFNPGTHYVNHTKVGVPHGNFTVKVFNSSSSQFQPANATVICDIEITQYQSCWLYTDYVLQGH
jgi:hypothetical protein